MLLVDCFAEAEAYLDAAEPLTSVASLVLQGQTFWI